jgi:O-antigen ligase
LASSGAFGAVRIMPPGDVLMHLMMVVAFCLMVFSRQNRGVRVITALQFTFLNVGILLTYTRSQWIAAATALGLILVVLIPAYKAQLARYLVVGSLVLLLMLSLLGTQLQEILNGTQVVNMIYERGVSIFTPADTLESDSLQWRVFENEEALRSITQYPLLGVGLGNAYREITLLQGEAQGRLAGLEIGRVSRFTRYVHSSYLALAVKMGLPGLASFLCFCALFLIKGFQLYRMLTDDYLRGIVLAVLASFAGLLQWSIFHARLFEAASAAVVGLMVGMVASIYKIQGHRSAARVVRRGAPPFIAVTSDGDV